MRLIILICFITSALAEATGLLCGDNPLCNLDCTNGDCTPDPILLEERYAYDKCDKNYGEFDYGGKRHRYFRSYEANCTTDPCLWCEEDPIVPCDGNADEEFDHLCEPPPPIPPCMGTLKNILFGCSECTPGEDPADLRGDCAALENNEPSQGLPGRCVGIWDGDDDGRCDCYMIKYWMEQQYIWTLTTRGVETANRKFGRAMKQFTCKSYDYGTSDYKYEGFDRLNDQLNSEVAAEVLAEETDRQFFLETQTTGGVPTYAIILLAVFGALSLISLCCIGAVMCARKYYVYDDEEDLSRIDHRESNDELVET